MRGHHVLFVKYISALEVEFFIVEWLNVGLHCHNGQVDVVEAEVFRE